MPKVGFSFAVVDKNGQARSDVWKVRVSNNSDIMVGNGSMGIYKYTLHAPRNGQLGCHFAWNSVEQIPANSPKTGRALHRWERRETVFGAANAVFSLNFPATFLAAPYSPKVKIDIPLAMPDDGHVAEFIFLFSRQRLALSNWPPDAVLKADLELPSGEFVHMLSWQRRFPDEFALSRIEQLYPARDFAALPPDITARLTIHAEPDENGCVKAIEVGGAALREMLSIRWASAAKP